MLPPFLPPSARGRTEQLPSITDFLLDEGSDAGGVAVAERLDATASNALPLIDEFLLAGADTFDAGREVEERADDARADAVAAEMGTTGSVGAAPGHPAPYAVVNDSTGLGSEWEASAVEPVERSASSDEPVQGSDWISAERDAFDWGGAASLAVPADEARRAADAWAGTEWEKGAEGSQEQIASLLASVARRVRAGELTIPGLKPTTPEGALAAALTALLSRPPQ